MVVTLTRGEPVDGGGGGDNPEPAAHGTVGEPVELLIPEARRRQRSRYRRRVVVALIAVAVLVALLVAGLRGVGARGPSAARAPGAPGSPGAAGAVAPVLVRPVLCFTRGAGVSARPSSSLPASCPPGNATTAASVDPRPAAGGTYDVHIVPDDRQLGTVASTSRDVATRVVLLSFADARRGRMLLGPAVLRLSKTTVSAVHLVPGSNQTWTVHIELSSGASARLDQVAFQYFHTYLAVDVGGTVVGDPLVEPAQSAFSSLQGRIDLVGNSIGGLSGPSARELATALGR